MPAAISDVPAAPAALITWEEVRHTADGLVLPALLWRAGAGWRMLSSAVVGGGLGERAWFLNAQVGHGYRRHDPEAHLAQIADAHVAGEGVAMMTAADIRRARGYAADGGAEALVTAGVGVCGWAAVPAEHAAVPTVPGTVNILVALPVPLSDAACVNAVATATEAKVQALLHAGYQATGTPTDAVCVAVRTSEASERAVGARGGGAYEPGVQAQRDATGRPPGPLGEGTLVERRMDGVPRSGEPREPVLPERVRGVRGERADGGGERATALALTPLQEGEPPVEPVQFAGPRSEWGGRLARAVHAATAEALQGYAAVRRERLE